MIKKLLKRKDTSPEAVADGSVAADVPPENAPRGNAWKRFCRWTASHKKISIPLAVVIVLGVLAAVPFTRYAVAGLFLQQNFEIVVLDSQTNKPVSSAAVTLDGKKATTNSAGKATVKAKVGDSQLTVTKQYYKDAKQSVMVTINKPKPLTVTLEATGRQVPVVVTNKLSGGVVKDATVEAEGSKVKTDDKGEAVIVLPPEKKEVTGTVSGEGFNALSVTIKVTPGVDTANTFAVTPSGRLHFLSNQSGKIDVVSSNLDGTDRKVVLAGTGKEEKQNTVLLATTDWKYLALQSKRDGGDYTKLFLIDTATGQTVVMDEGNASFNITGWSGHRFIYKVNRTTLQPWQPKQQALKSYNADTKKITTLDETTASGTGQNNYLFERMENVYSFGDTVVYTKQWTADPYTYNATIPSKQTAFMLVKVDGTGKKTVKTFGNQPGRSSADTPYIETRPYGADELYLRLYQNTAVYYEYHDGQVKEDKTITSDQFNSEYSTYLISPDGNSTLWSETRDGKNTLFVGDTHGDNGKQIASLSEYATFGWYTKDYLLVTKKGSELYILPASGLAEGKAPFKVSDYYRPAYNFYGYGGGYGGL